jgi:hypothetical protein
METKFTTRWFSAQTTVHGISDTTKMWAFGKIITTTTGPNQNVIR